MDRFVDLARRLWVSTRRPGFCRTGALVAVIALGLGIISGAAVRLTGSGLGCADWPACTSTSVVAPLQFHAWMEFGNRLVNAAVTVGVVMAVAGAWLRRPRRRDVRAVSVGLLVGIAAEVVLGGETVLHKLAPPFVMAHFLLALALMVNAVVLYHRASLPEEAVEGRPGYAQALPARRLVRPGQVLAARAMLGLTFVVVALGTVVTSTGPHAGAPGVKRFGFSLHTVAQLHGTTVELLLALTVGTLWSLHRGGASPLVLKKAELVLVVLVAQAGVGYTQYLSGDPVLLVGIHVAGATSVVVAMLVFNFGLFQRQPAMSVAAVPVVPAPNAGLVGA